MDYFDRKSVQKNRKIDRTLVTQGVQPLPVYKKQSFFAMVFVRLLLLCALFLWFPSAWKRWTHAFRLAKCAVEWPYRLDWEAPEPDDAICAILQEPFTYLDKGAQSYVFLSADQKYVLKLFRFDSCRIPLGQRLVRLARKWAHLREKHFLPLEVKVPKTFDSCSLSYHLAPDLTGVIWVHLNPRPIKVPFIRVIDRLKVSHRIDPAIYRFVIQKKAKPFLQVLRDAPDPLPYVRSYFSLLSKLSKLGLANLDPNMGKNFGFIDGEAVEIDFGNFAFNHTLAAQDPEQFSKRLIRWLKQHRPDCPIPDIRPLELDFATF